MDESVAGIKKTKHVNKRRNCYARLERKSPESMIGHSLRAELTVIPEEITLIPNNFNEVFLKLKENGERNKKLIFLTLIVILCIFQCSEKESITQSEIGSVNTDDLNSTGLLQEDEDSGVQSELKGWLEPVAEYLSKNPQKLPKSDWITIREKPISLSKMGSEVDFPEILATSDNTDYKLEVEIYHGSNLIDPKEIIITLDPDVFYPENPLRFPCYKIVEGSSKPVISQYVLESNMSKISGIIFFVSPQEIHENPRPELKKSATALPYLCLSQIQITDNQDASNEEFELFCRAGTSHFPSTTIHLFDGDDHTDASGNSKYYENVNLVNHTYPGNDIALVCLADNLEGKILPIEDDKKAGCFCNFRTEGGTIEAQDVDTYDRSTKTNSKKTQKIYICTKSLLDEDDFYNSAFVKFNVSNMPPEEAVIYVVAGYVHLWLKVKYI